MFEIYKLNAFFLDKWDMYLNSENLMFSYDIDKDFIKTFYCEKPNQRKIRQKHRYILNSVSMEYKEFESKVFHFNLKFNNIILEFLCDASRDELKFYGKFGDAKENQDLIYGRNCIFLVDGSRVNSLDFIDLMSKKTIDNIK